MYTYSGVSRFGQGQYAADGSTMDRDGSHSLAASLFLRRPLLLEDYVVALLRLPFVYPSLATTIVLGCDNTLDLGHRAA